MEEKQKCHQVSQEYRSWDFYQRTVKSNSGLDQSSQIKAKIDLLMNEIEVLLDGPNEDFDQTIYLQRKDELQKLIDMLESGRHIKQLAS